jgi:hypothetical protein
MECPNCHHWNEDGARFCEECGFEIGAAAPVDPAAVQVSISGGVNNEAAINHGSQAESVPPPPAQDLVPSEPAANPFYVGPRLVLDKSGTIFKLGDATVIGREDPGAQIDFDGYEDGKYISHRHAQITKTDGKFFLEDLGSTNATRVNGVKLQSGQAQPLKQGDKVRFGKIELTFHEN